MKTTKGEVSVKNSKESFNKKPTKENIYQKLFSTNFDQEQNIFDGNISTLTLKWLIHRNKRKEGVKKSEYT